MLWAGQRRCWATAACCGAPGTLGAPGTKDAFSVCPLRAATGGLGTVVPADGPPTNWVARSRSFINSWFML